MQLKKPRFRFLGIALLAAFLLIIAGELTADAAQVDGPKAELRVGFGAPADTTYGGSQNPDEDNGDPNYIDRQLPAWWIVFANWLLTR